MTYYGVVIGETAYGPFRTHEEATAFAQANGGNNENVYALFCPDFQPALRKLQNALEMYADAYDKWDGRSETIFEGTGLLSRKNLSVLESPLKEITPFWYRCATVNAPDINDYTDANEWVEAVNNWIEEAESLTLSLEYATRYLDLWYDEEHEQDEQSD